jgi:hypothetical protein
MINIIQAYYKWRLKRMLKPKIRMTYAVCWACTHKSEYAQIKAQIHK